MTELVSGERPGLTRWEQALRLAGAGLAFVSIGFALWYFVKGITGDTEFPYVANSVAKDALLAGLALVIVYDVRRWATIAVPLIVAAHVLMPIILLATSAWGDTNGIQHTWSGPPADPEQFRQGWILADVGVVIVFVVSHHMAIRSRYGLRYLPPSAFRSLMALAEILVLHKDREIAPAQVAGRVDSYLADFRAKQKWKIRLILTVMAYLPLLSGRPPFHVMSPTMRQRWVQRHFLDDVSDRVGPEFLRNVRQVAIRTAQQFCFMGYYGDEGAAERAGYIPFSKRDNYDLAVARVEPDRPRLRTMGAADVPGEELTADVVIVGSGAGGATLARELLARGREVLILERGPHVDPSEFTENEAKQLSQLYADGALTLSADFRFQVAQGMCVGGSTVVNNAVCFDLPDAVRDRWLGDELQMGLDRDRLAEAFVDVRKFLKVSKIGPSESLSPGANRLVPALRERVDWPYELVECNVVDCLGCGYCNIGCAFGKKLSALDWTLPRAQADHGDALRILPGCRVDKVLMRGPRAYGVRARLDDGRRLIVRANTVVLSAGAIASSLILQRSGLGEGRAGQGLSFNMASPVTLDFHPDVLHAERGIQITHYAKPQNGAVDGLAFETWFNPIVSQSLFMPGWFDAHWDNMRHYRNMTCLGVVVGTRSNGSVKASRLGGVDFRFRPCDEDFVKLKEGVRLACEVGLKAGAARALPATFRLLDIRSEADLPRIELEIGDDSDISVNSAHPQGGNPMSNDPLKGVVDPQFRVYGALNLYVCDASVFPSSITVNPQLTVMALAAYAGRTITT